MKSVKQPISPYKTTNITTPENKNPLRGELFHRVTHYQTKAFSVGILLFLIDTNILKTET